LTLRPEASMKRWWVGIAVIGLASGCASIHSGMPDDPHLLRPTGTAEVPTPEPPRLIAGELPLIPADNPEPGPATPLLAHREDTPPASALLGDSATTPQPQNPRPTDTPLPLAESDHQVAPAALPAAAGREAADAITSLESDVGEPATEVAARVGESIITLRELKNAVRSRMKPGVSWAQLSHEQKNRVGRESLEFLIDRALIIQEARRTLDKPKQWDTFKEVVDKMWRDNELPDVMKRYGVQNEAALRQKLEQGGFTLAEIHQDYLLDQMARIFTSERMRAKYTEPGFREIYGYYRENLETFRQPAQFTWREIFVAVDETNDRESARSKAQNLHARISSGEDFARIARSESQSPRASDGGLWQTSPGGFGSKVVNEALENLAIGATSEVLEDSKGFYIVRIEARRTAGPAPFEEVQGRIAEVLRSRAYEKQMQAYLSEIRGRTPVSSPLFDGGPSQPLQSASGAAAAP
jgi:hypothetical protein